MQIQRYIYQTTEHTQENLFFSKYATRKEKTENKYLIEGYSYGFQGEEVDDEIKGEGNSVNYTFRMHDPRVGRFFAIDPLTKKYPHYSPYSFSGNKVIHRIELEGLEDSKFNTTLYDANLRNASADELKAYSAAQTEAMIASSIVLIDIFITKGWLSRGYFVANIGENINSSENYYDAVASGDTQAAEKYRKEMKESGGVVALGFMAELAVATNFTKLFTKVKNTSNPSQASAVIDDAAATVKPNTAANSTANVVDKADDVAVGTKVSAQKMKGKGHLDSGTKSGMKSIEDAQQVLDNYNAGKLEVISSNPANGQVVVKDPSVTGIHRTNGGTTQTNSNVFVIKGQTSVTVFPKNPTTTAGG